MIVLASGSEWRARLMSIVGVGVVISPSDVDEEVDEGCDLEDMVQILARRKSEYVFNKILHDAMVTDVSGVVHSAEDMWWVVGADTMVEHDGVIIGKPRDREHAADIIQSLQGSTHRVLTGVCVWNEMGEQRLSHEETSLTIGPMSERQIEEYLATDEWVGKAGGYQLLKSIHKYVHSIDGGVSNVIGLPMKLTLSMLNDLGCDLDVDSSQRLMETIGYPD